MHSSAQCDRRLEVNYPLFVYFNLLDLYQYPVDSSFDSQSVQLEIDTTETVCIENVYEGYFLRLSNYEATDISLRSIDGAIFIYAEALFDTCWLPVTSIRAETCGNGYYFKELKSGFSVEFPTPAFTGTFATRIRYVLIHRASKIYSNEINAHIHPEQWNDLNFSENEREMILDVNHYVR